MDFNYNKKGPPMTEVFFVMVALGAITSLQLFG